ncbi:MAG: N-acetylmuramoyl-L-alanine amidase [Ruminococcus sp.]|nr:N-acetylmuramoyl-L-alanine amidase [Ruminococcus sp.]
MRKSLLNNKVKRLMIALILVGACVGISYVNQKVSSESIALTSTTPSKSDRIVILDAGHGGMDGGCSAQDGTVEKDINLNILLNLRDMLTASGYTVEVTRDTDISIHDKGIEGIANQKSSDMDNRLALFNKYDNAICISIHQNLFTDSKYSGAQMFYSDTNPKSETLANILQNKFVEYLQPDNQREIKLCGKELFLCYFSENPTVMAECGFLSNPEEAELLKDSEYQKKVAFTIYSAINEYYSSI